MSRNWQREHGKHKSVVQKKMTKLRWLEIGERVKKEQGRTARDDVK